MENYQKISAGVGDLQPICLAELLERHARPGETTIGDIQRRTAHAVGIDAPQAERFLSAMQAGLVPGGSLHEAAGSSGTDMLIRDFVQPISDTMSGSLNGVPGVMEALANAVATMRMGGGVGYDFSELRPKGAVVRGSPVKAAGPVAIARMFEKAAEPIEHAGSQLAVLRVDHPDIRLFVDAKMEMDFSEFGLHTAQVTYLKALVEALPDFGLRFKKAFTVLSAIKTAVAVTEEFMDAVVNDGTYNLVHDAEPGFPAARVACTDGKQRFLYESVQARVIWAKLIRNAFESRESGILYMGHINSENNLRYCERVTAASARGALPLPGYGSNDLGHINLSKFVDEPFTVNASFNFQKFVRVATIAVEFLDRVLDVTSWPLPQQKSEAMNKRRIGAGYFAAGDALAMLGLGYDSDAGAGFLAKVTAVLRDTTYLASVELAKKEGPFAYFDSERFLEEGTFASRLPEYIKDSIRKHGIRNSQLMVLADSESIARTFGNNSSSGIEPIACLSELREQAGTDGQSQSVQVHNNAFSLFKRVDGRVAVSAGLVSAADVSTAAQMRVLSAVAPFVDGAVTKTLLVTDGTSPVEIEEFFMDGWILGLKSLGTNRRVEFGQTSN